MTWYHELIHWTGAEHRLARRLDNRFGDRRCAFEELVAEIGAAFLCQDHGISPTVRDDPMRYTASWIQLLRQDRR